MITQLILCSSKQVHFVTCLNLIVFKAKTFNNNQRKNTRIILQLIVVHDDTLILTVLAGNTGSSMSKC